MEQINRFAQEEFGISYGSLYRLGKGVINILSFGIDDPDIFPLEEKTPFPVTLCIGEGNNDMLPVFLKTVPFD
jgi:hypothetical protein